MNRRSLVRVLISMPGLEGGANRVCLGSKPSDTS